MILKQKQPKSFFFVKNKFNSDFNCFIKYNLLFKMIATSSQGYSKLRKTYNIVVRWDKTIIIIQHVGIINNLPDMTLAAENELNGQIRVSGSNFYLTAHKSYRGIVFTNGVWISGW